MTDFLHHLAVALQNRDLEFDPKGMQTPLFRVVELAGEVGEFCNVVKKLEREALHLGGSRATRQQLEDELGDILICLALVANSYDVNLEAVATRKFNLSSDKLGLDVRL